MALSPFTGKPAPQEMLVDLGRLERAYFAGRPDPADPAQRVRVATYLVITSSFYKIEH